MRKVEGEKAENGRCEVEKVERLKMEGERLGR
jgi:hypothetical protein